MKTNINIFNNLNESLEKELKSKRRKKLKESVKSKKSRKLNEEEYSFEEIITRMSNATDYSELYDAALLIKNNSLRADVENMIDTCENDGDTVEEAYSIVTSDLLDMYVNDLNESKENKSNKKLNETKKTLDDVYSDKDTEALWDKKYNELVPNEGKADSTIGEILRCFSRISYAYLQNGEIISNMQQSYLQAVWDLDDALKELGDTTLSSLLDKMYNTRSNSAYDHYMASFYEYFVNNYLKNSEDSEKSLNETEDNDFYNYVKDLLDSGAIDDLKHYNSLSDKEKEDLIRNTWMKDKDIIEDYKRINESENIDINNLTKEQLWKLRKEIVLGSLYINDYKNSFNINPQAVYNFFDSFIEDAQQDDEGNFNNRKTEDFDNAEDLYNYYISCENPFGDLNESEKLKEEEIVRINDTEIEPDYLIQDVTVLDQVGDGDIQSPDIEALLTLVDSALKENYSENWGHIKTLSSKIEENNSYALVDISTPEILKEFESRGIKDAAIGKNLILEKVNNKLVEFKVNNLNGTTKYSKKTTNPQKAIYEWLESEFLQEAKEEKAKEAEVAKAKTEKETVENYINNRLDLKMEIENIKMFIELSKEVKAQEEMKPSIQNRMYAFAVEVPYNIEVTNKDDKYELTFNNIDEVVAMIFGKEWVKEPTPDNEVIGVIKESQKLTEAYEQFNIGEIEVVFNPDTYETLYSIPSADVQDKKINLTKVPTVDTPYDTDTIIKSYIETKFGRIPTEEEKEMIDNKEVSEPQPEESEPAPETQEEIPQDDSDLTEDELPDEPEENEVPDEAEPEEETPEAETGSAVFMKIRPKQNSSVEDLRRRQLDGDTPTSNYIVVDTLELSPEEFNDLISNLSEQRSYLEGIQALDRKNYSFNVIKVTSSDSSYDLLIDPLGYNYPRYVAISDKNLNSGI